MQISMWFEKPLVMTLWLFAFVALVFEPLYYFGCDWSYEGCAASPHEIVVIVGNIWKIYCDWDPLFLDIPSWLRVMCIIEVFVFGPLYAICAYGLQYNAKWLPNIALPFSGALFYSTVVYFAMEFAYIVPGTNVFMVFVVNVPWSIAPVFLAYAAVARNSLKRKDV
mmetsp:Transcript_8606/g.12843  ORF Transcript_8606/g.12843 Transcript_8606/m.12843 type:complete len:166 (-) Transcript_8606:51-548(-)